MSSESPLNPQEPAIADPLGRFVGNHRRSLGRRGPRFNAGEHAWLASRGAEEARDELERSGRIRGIPKELFLAIPRGALDETLQYGEIVALSGDFYETPCELFDEKSSLISIPMHSNDLQDLRAIFAAELQWIVDRLKGEGGATYPDENIRLAWNAKSYIELALRNTDHFGWHNIVAYSRHHAEALRLAESARGGENETFRRALYTNAFADHFLTDGFAAGHVRVPCAQIRAWAARNGLTEKVAGALIKLLHDQDGHVDVRSLHGSPTENARDPTDGLWVQDSTGASWHTYCDGQLFLRTREGSSPAVEHAVGAVRKSVKELLIAWKEGELPRGVYEATRLVPVPHPEAPRLVDKFPAELPEADLDALWNSTSWYTKVPWISGLTRKNVQDLLAALPGLMEEFRLHVAAAAVDVDLRGRIDSSYVDAYKGIG